MSTPFDRLLVNRIPGSNTFKAIVTTLLITGAAVYAFPPGTDSNTKQGHSLFSHEKPEAVAAHEQRMREEKRRAREQQKE